LLATVTLVTACGGADYVVPSPDLGQGLVAQRDMQKLRAAWDTGPWAERLDLQRALIAHAHRYPADPTSRSANAMLALLLVEKGQPERALAVATPLTRGPEGATRDAATVAMGAAKRKMGDAAGALAAMRPLFNKVIDGPTRGIMNRELLLAAVEVGRFDLGARYLEAYVSQADPIERAGRQDEARALVARFPAGPLFALLEREQQRDAPDRFLLGVVADRLASLTIASEDVALARALLATAGALLGERADDVARIAARGATVRLERNTVGLLLPLRTPELRRRGLDVAAGLSAALGLPGGKTRLLIRDDQGKQGGDDDALALLNADGAAVIVAGFDRESADAASAYGLRTGVPVVLLRPPSQPIPKDGHVFVIGDDPVVPRRALAAELVRLNAGPVAMLVDDRDADVPTEGGKDGVIAVQPCGAPLDFVRASGARAVIVDGSSRCANETSGGLGGGITLAFGPDAGAAAQPGVHVWAGIYPLAPGPSDDPTLEAYRRDARTEPSWWVALGHDAGALVKDAVAALPGEGEANAAASSQRKDLVASGIAAAKGALWTTDASGFQGARALARSFRVESRGVKARR
jgi:hypothetical protein